MLRNINRFTNLTSIFLLHSYLTHDSSSKNQKFTSKTIDKSVESSKKIGESLHKDECYEISIALRIWRVTNLPSPFLPLKIPSSKNQKFTSKTMDKSVESSEKICQHLDRHESRTKREMSPMIECIIAGFPLSTTISPAGAVKMAMSAAEINKVALGEIPERERERRTFAEGLRERGRKG